MQNQFLNGGHYHRIFAAAGLLDSDCFMQTIVTR